jgi:putative transposase
MTAATKTGQAADGELGGREAAELELARQLAERAQAEGLALTGPGGLLGRLTKVLEGALEGELDAHLGMRSTTRPAAMAGTPATGTGPRP